MAYDGHFLWRPPTALASMYIPRGNPLTTPFLSQIPVLTYEYEHTYNWRQPEQFTTQEHILNHDLDHRENMKWRKFLFRRSPKKESNTDGGYNNSRRYRGKDNNAKRARGKLPQPRKKSSQTENDDVATKEVVSPKSIEKGQEKKAPSSIPRSSIPTANKRSWKNETTPVRRIPSTSSKAKIEKQHSILSEASTASIETEKVRELEAKCENYENQINLLKSEFRRKNLALEAFTAVVNHYLSVIDIQRADHSQVKEEIKEVKDELAGTDKLAAERLEELNGLKEKLQNAIEDHAKALENLKSEHKHEVDSIKEDFTKEHEDRIERVNADFNQKFSKQADDHKKEIKNLQSTHEIYTTRLNQEHSSNIENMKKEFSIEKKDIKDEHQVEMETVTRDYEYKLQKLTIEVDSLRAEKKRTGEKINELSEQLENDVDSRVQYAVAQYKHLPAELESLQAIVDMKNEEIKKIRIKNMELQKRCEDYFELENKYEKALYQKEAIESILDRKSKYERQLSVERDSLAMSLEKETRKVSRLSMEKEELLWRFRESSHLSQSSPALNHDISPTFSPIEADRSHRSKSSTLPANRSLKTQSLYLPALEDDDFTVL